MKMKIKKGDEVVVISGKDKGKTGKVVKSFPADAKVLVEGVNMKKVHRKAGKNVQKGQVIEVAAPLHVSNVMLLDPKSKKGTRVGMSLEKGKKTRVAKRSGATV